MAVDVELANILVVLYLMTRAVCVDVLVAKELQYSVLVVCSFC